jgi:hypothetical protein
LLEVLDKGKAASVTFIAQTKDKSSGQVIFENQSTVFIRGSGGFGGKKKGNGALQKQFFSFAIELTHGYFYRPGPSICLECSSQAQF